MPPEVASAADTYGMKLYRYYNRLRHYRKQRWTRSPGFMRRKQL